MTVRNSIAALVALFVLSGVACSSGDSELGAMTLRPLAGVVEIHRGNEVISVTDDESLEPQDVVVTGKRGLAQLELEDENTITMVKNSEMRIRSTSTVEGQKGTLVAEGSSMKVLFDGVESHLADAVFRLDQSFGSSRAASYSGTVHLSAPGEAGIVLDTLYEVDVAAGDLPDRPSPYDLDPGDALDTKYLSEVIELADDLDLKGFSRQLGRSRPSLADFSDLAGTSRIGFMRSYLTRAPGDLIVAFLIASNDPKLSLKQSFVRAFRLRDAGAQWAVAATIMDVETNPLLAQLDRLILGTSVVADGPGASADFTFASVDGGPSSGGTDPGGSDDDPNETINGGTGGTGDADGDGGNGDGDSDDCTGTVDCAVEDVEDELPPGPGPDPEPEPNTDPRDVDLLDDAGKL